MLSSNEQYVSQLAPQGSARRAPLLMWGVTAMVAFAWMGLIFGAPLLLANGYEAAASAIHGSFSVLCHQQEERSFHLAGHALAVCSRCTAIYAGVAAGILFYPFARSLKETETPSRVWLLLAPAPAAIDWTLGFFGLWENTFLSRSVTGGLLGLVLAFYIVPGLVDLGQINWRTFLTTKEKGEQPQRESIVAQPARSAPSDYSSPSSRI